jgi:multidrug resistance efflux pump
VAAEISKAALAEDTARAQLALAQYEVDARAVRAPIAGRIIRRLASPGEGTSTAPVTPLFWLAPDGPRIVRAQLDEDSVLLVAPGQLAEVVTESAASRVISARVQRVGLYFGPKRPATDDPAERQDMRVVDCVLVLEDATPPLLIGQRVLVRFLSPDKSAR